MARHGTDREVLWLLVQAVGRAVPSRERWEQIWREVRVEVDKKDPAHPRVTAVWPARVRPGAPPASIPSQVHTGQPITLDLKDGDLQEVFRLFADVTQLNVVVNPAIQGAVTIRVSDAPWDEALEQILAVNGYTYRIEGNVLTIARPGDLPPPRTYTGRVIDVDLRDEPLESAFRQIARQGGMDVEIGPRVGGRLSLVLKSVRWDQAFDIVARVNGLTWTRKNGVLRVAHPGS